MHRHASSADRVLQEQGRSARRAARLRPKDLPDRRRLPRGVFAALDPPGLPARCRESRVNQIAALERRTARGGKDSIGHAPGARRLGQRDRRRGLLRRQPLYVERFGVADLARDQRSRAVDLGH